MKLHLLTTSLLLASATATMEAGEPTVWTYNDCVEYARAHNISLQKSLLAETTADCDLDEAKAQWQPSLDFSTTHGYTNSPWSDGPRNIYNSSYGFGAGWTVWDGGRRENNIRRSQLATEISRLNTGDIMRTLETDLLQVYINILYAREAIGIYQEAAKLSEAQADRARQLMEAGRVSRVDYAQLKSQYEQDRYALVNAQATYDTRRMELKKLLELGIDSDIRPADVEWTDSQVLAPLPPIEESYTLAVATDLKIRGLELEKETAALDVDIARAGSRPSIALSAGVSTGYSAPGGDSFANGLKKGLNENIGVSLTIPIFDNKKTRSAVARAKVQQLNADLDIDLRNTELAQTVESWYIDTRSAQARFTAAQQQLESTLLSNQLTNEQFNLGLVNPVELMTAHNDLVNARQTLLQAKCMAILGLKMIEFYRTSSVTL